MNKPLRHEGYTFYQASFIESPSGEETTVLAAVKKLWKIVPPIFSSIIMSIGLLLHMLVSMPNLFKKSIK